MKNSGVELTRSRSDASRLMIAVADDNPDLQAILREWLTAAGHAVACASDGLELCRMSREHRFDLVITDVMMPERDGFEVIAELKEHSPELRIIAVSGGGATMRGADCLRVARRLGADAVLAKPFQRVQLLALVEKVAGIATAKPASV